MEKAMIACRKIIFIQYLFS